MIIPVYVGVSKYLNCRGLMASRNIKAEEIIECCPIILLPDWVTVENCTLGDYYFSWAKNNGAWAVGYAVLMNHKCPSNVKFVCNYKKYLINFIAAKDIEKDEELFINYGGGGSTHKDAKVTFFGKRWSLENTEDAPTDIKEVS